MTDSIEAHIASEYDVQERLGKGAYGIVWKAVDRATGDVVAVKKIFDAFRNVTDAQRTFREIIYLQAFHDHESVIGLQNVVKAGNDKDIYLVFDHMDTDLNRAIEGKLLQGVHIQYVMHQCLKALAYMHSADVIHRDLKPSNVLLNDDCRAALCDFGLARSLHDLREASELSNGQLTEYVATRWYRAPEILLGSSNYTTAVDMWSIGCVLGEMLVGKPLFTGADSFRQVHLIVQCLGIPSHSDVKAMRAPYAEACFSRCPRHRASPLSERVSQHAAIRVEGLDLLAKLLVFNPEKRISAQQALRHPFLKGFHNKSHERQYGEPVRLPFDDNIRLTIADYRTHLYDDILRKNEEIQAERQLTARPAATVPTPTSARAAAARPTSARDHPASSRRTLRDPGMSSRGRTEQPPPSVRTSSARGTPRASQPPSQPSARTPRNPSARELSVRGTGRDASARHALPPRHRPASATAATAATAAPPRGRAAPASARRSRPKPEEDKGPEVPNVSVDRAVSIARAQQGAHTNASSRSSRAHALRNTSSVFGGLSDTVDYPSRPSTGTPARHARASSKWREAPPGYGRTGPGDASGGIFRASSASAASRGGSQRSAASGYSSSPWGIAARPR